MDARISIVKQLGLGSRFQGSRKYSTIAPVVDAMVEDARSHLYLQNQLHKDEKLFASPLEFTQPIDDSITICPLKVESDQLKWACSQVLRLHRLSAKSSSLRHGGLAIVFRMLRGDGSSADAESAQPTQSWVVVNNFKCSETLGEVRFSDGVCAGCAVEFVRPLRILQSFDVFCAFYEARGPTRQDTPSHSIRFE